ncbi:bifunctional aminoglycoside phosphotransferase/ATP-binding protein [Actinomadura rudentiformis]|uniref:AAA family ATPase n=1 Tax=Actinomadura rudentiformis TaxID=359158 RepID=A0A6H9YZK0_9ACTN|nr:bifunctional aminoglycoside phosphotransferase/ATP-binding protein [Actinomadura rudentiformis]KAB2352250.1 AAA family ATPase [Actinomadura rudentiformis]
MTSTLRASPSAEGPAAAVSETHIGIVFFAGDRAYKLKKPVDLDFLDFSTRQAREHACNREVELNRRFSPDVYLGVADVHGPSGEVCDHLVVMRRMPGARRLATLVRAHAPVDDTLRTIAKRLAAWHAIAPRGPAVSAEGTRDALRDRWKASFEQVRPFHDQAIPAADALEIERLTRRFLDGRRPLFDSRVTGGRIVDGHGDLLAGDIFVLDDGPRILDCLEFDDRLRYLDGLDDAAFLAMDLERLGAPHLAEHFMRRYAEYAADPAPPSLRHHYVAYRAFVRAKVACFRHQQGDPHAAAEARALGQIALRHLRAGRVSLILVGGLPGTGKTTLAGALADQLGCTMLSSDRTRKELAGLPAEESAAAPYGTGIYDPSSTDRTYATLLDRARRLLQMGETVLLDASWIARSHRDEAIALASEFRADFHALRCEAPARLATERLRTRPHGASDADTKIAAAMAADAVPWPGATTIDTSGPVDKAVEQALSVIRPDIPSTSSTVHSSPPGVKAAKATG